MWQQRCLELVDELSGSDDVLYVDRLADILAPMTDGASIAELIAGAVIAGELSLIASATGRAGARAPQVARAGRRDARGPGRRGHAGATIALLEPYGQRHHAARRARSRRAAPPVELLAAFRRDTAFPGKALAFVDYLATRSAHSAPASDSRDPARAIRIDELTAAFATWSGLPVELLAPEHALASAAIAAQLRAGVIGQDHACSVAAPRDRRLKAGLDDPQRPVGALLFAGPTGVGKTELASSSRARCSATPNAGPAST